MTILVETQVTVILQSMTSIVKTISDSGLTAHWERFEFFMAPEVVVSRPGSVRLLGGKRACLELKEAFDQAFGEWTTGLSEGGWHLSRVDDLTFFGKVAWWRSSRIVGNARCMRVPQIICEMHVSLDRKHPTVTTIALARL
jgi:hypothetical protein